MQLAPALQAIPPHKHSPVLHEFGALQALLQHEPCSQRPLVHSFLTPQLAPLAFLASQTPALHQLPDAQSLSIVQLLLQLGPPQMYAPHSIVVSAQLPSPPQTLAVSTPALHELSPHLVSADGNEQAE
jgi:hypothetical protein